MWTGAGVVVPVASDAIVVQLLGQEPVRYFVKRFCKIHDDKISLDFAVTEWGQVDVQEQELGFT